MIETNTDYLKIWFRLNRKDAKNNRVYFYLCGHMDTECTKPTCGWGCVNGKNS